MTLVFPGAWMGWWILPLSPGLQFTLTMKPSAQCISLEDVGPHTQCSDFFTAATWGAVSKHPSWWSTALACAVPTGLPATRKQLFNRRGNVHARTHTHTHTHTHIPCSSYTQTQHKGSRTKWPSPSSSPEGDWLLPCSATAWGSSL